MSIACSCRLIVRFLFSTAFVFGVILLPSVNAKEILRAGAAKVEITDHTVSASGNSYVRVLALQKGRETVFLMAIDVVALAEIGRLPSDFVQKVKGQLAREFGVKAENVVVTASHAHTVVRQDIDVLAISAARKAFSKLRPAVVGRGITYENSISENRRIKLIDGREIDVRHAYALPSDGEMLSTGKIDPELGVVRVDSVEGAPIAVLYNFSAHPILGRPGVMNSSDYPGFASEAIENVIGGDTVSLFLQGAAGDVNPRGYKDIHRVRDSKPIGERLALRVLEVWRNTKPDSYAFQFQYEMVRLPVARDIHARIQKNMREQQALIEGIQPTSLDFRSFVELYVQQQLNPSFPSASKYRYLSDSANNLSDLAVLDQEKRENVRRYLSNIYAIEQLTRLRVNQELLLKHQNRIDDEKRDEIVAEVSGFRIGDARFITFPGELSVEIGIAIKEKYKEKNAYIVGYSNGYIYYTPTLEQRLNTGYAQEDCESLISPEWQMYFDAAVENLMSKL